MTDKEKLLLSKRIFSRIQASGDGGLSLNVIEKEFEIGLYLLQEAVKSLVGLEVLISTKSPSKDFPYNELLIITPKGEYISNDKKGLDSIWKHERKAVPTYKLLKSLISKGELKDVLDILSDKVEKIEHINFLVVQSARYVDIERAFHLNIVDWNSASITKSQIIKAVLELIDELEAIETGEQAYSPIDNFVYTVAESDILGFQIISKLPKGILNREVTLVLGFLTKFDRWYFSPLRIKKWGGRQQGFENLNKLSSQKIKKILEEVLLIRKEVVQTISKKGNPIFKVSLK